MDFIFEVLLKMSELNLNSYFFLANNPPATVTCGVCGAVRFYRFVRQARKFGIYSCESCRKFISKLLKKDKMVLRTQPVITHCVRGEGKEMCNTFFYIFQYKLNLINW